MKKYIKQHLIISILLFLILSFASITYTPNCAHGFLCGIGALAVMILAAIFFTLFFIISTSFIVIKHKKKQSVSHIGVYIKSVLVLIALVIGFALLQQIPSMLQTLGTLLLREPPSATQISNPGEHYILMRDSDGYSGNRYVVMNISGTIVKHIDATEAITHQSPTLNRISPHGSSLLLYKGKAQEQSLLLTNLTGEIIKTVKTSCQKTEFPYLWSDDGSKIAFNCVDKEQYQTETVIYDIFDDTYVYISQKLWKLSGDNSVRTDPQDPIFSPDK